MQDRCETTLLQPLSDSSPQFSPMILLSVFSILPLIHQLIHLTVSVPLFNYAIHMGLKLGYLYIHFVNHHFPS